MQRSQTLVALLLLAGATVAWAGNIVIGRAVSADLPPLALSFWRWAITFAILLAFSGRAFWASLPLIRKHVGLLALMAVLGMATFHPLQYFSVQTTLAINATLILSTSPAMVAILSYFILGERLRLSQIIGAVVSFFGVAFVISKADLTSLLALEFTKGDIWMLGAAIVWSLYSIAVKFRPQGMEAIPMLTATAGLGALMLLPFYIWESMNGQPLPLTQQAFVTIAYISVVASLLAYLAFNQGVALIGPAKAGIILHLVPVWVTLLAVVFLGERLAHYHIVGLVLIAIGIALSNRPQRRGRPVVKAEG